MYVYIRTCAGCVERRMDVRYLVVSKYQPFRQSTAKQVAHYTVSVTVVYAKGCWSSSTGLDYYFWSMQSLTLGKPRAYILYAQSLHKSINN